MNSTGNSRPSSAPQDLLSSHIDLQDDEDQQHESEPFDESGDDRNLPKIDEGDDDDDPNEDNIENQDDAQDSSDVPEEDQDAENAENGEGGIVEETGLEDGPDEIELPQETEEEMRVRIREEEKQERWNKYVNEQCTTLHFFYADGKKKDYLLHHLVDDYSSLQREIARLHPKSKQLFVCQFMGGLTVR